MSSIEQILANRQNAQKSTGPKSAEGKAVVAKNAIKHGLFAIETVIKGENREDFDLFREKLLEEFAPQGAVETMLTERIVSLGWRLKRIVRVQDQVFDVMIEKDEPSPMQKQINSMKPRQMRDDRRGTGPDLVLGRAAIKDMSNSRVLERLLMYERRIENSLHKTLDELHKRKLVRELEQANKAVEAEDFDMMDHPQTHPQASLGVATLSTEVGSRRSEGRGQMTEDRKQKSEHREKIENKPNSREATINITSLKIT